MPLLDITNFASFKFENAGTLIKFLIKVAL